MNNNINNARVTDIGEHGLLHTVRVCHTGDHFMGLNRICQETPCHAAYHDVTEFLRPEEKALVVQNGGDPSEILVTKTPNGFIFHNREGSCFSVMHAEDMYLPDDQKKKTQLSDYTLLAQAYDPRSNMQPKTIHISMHNGPCPPNVISRDSPMQHIESQLGCLTKLNCDPRELYSSDNLGTFSGRVLQGDTAQLLKEGFLALADHFKENGMPIYENKLNLLPEISEPLMLKNVKGEISLHRGVDCIVGCRKRKVDNGHTFIFAMNSDDFEEKGMSNAKNSMVQVFKMDYHKKSKNSNAPKQRISFIMHPGDVEGLAPAYQNQTILHGQMTMQTMLNHVSHSFKEDKLKELNCQHFFPYIQLMQSNQMVG
jgi:hypothetical protein